MSKYWRGLPTRLLDKSIALTVRDTVFYLLYSLLHLLQSRLVHTQGLVHLA